MKFRSGFVTNSSSSSFVMCFKKQVSDKELEQKILSVFGLPEGHILSGMANDVAKVIVDSIRCASYYGPGESELKELIEEFCYNDDCEYAQLLAEYGNLRLGYWSDDSDASERWLCENDLNYEDDQIVILHDGGY